MPQNLDVTIRLNGDGSGLIGSARLSREEMEKLRAELDETQSTAGRFGEGLGSLALKVGAYASGVAAAALATDKLLGDALEEEQRIANLAAQLGLATESAEAYSKTADRVFRRIGGEDGIDGIADKLVDASRRFEDASQAQLGGLVGNVEKVSRVFDEDFGDSIDVVETLMQNFKLTSEEALDFYVAAQQRGLNANDDLADSITEYAAQFKNAGADAGEFFSVLETGLANGVLGTDKGADLFGEYVKRIQDGSATTADALAQIGINAEDFSRRLGDGSLDAVDGFNEIIDRLKNTEDATLRMQASTGLLGTQFEDLGAIAALNISTTSTSMEELAGAMDSLGATGATSTARFDRVMRELDGVIRDISTPAILYFTEIAADGLEAVLHGINQLPIAWEHSKTALVLGASLVDEAFDFVINKIEAALAAVLDKAGTVVFHIPGLAETGLELDALAREFKAASLAERDFKAERQGIIDLSQSTIESIRQENDAHTEAIRITQQSIETDQERAKTINAQRQALEKKTKAEKSAEKATKAHDKALKAAAKSEQKRLDSIDDHIAKLIQEQEKLGLSAAELEIYELKKLGADDATQQLAASLREEIDTQQALIKEQDAAARAGEEAASRMRDAYIGAFDEANNALGSFLNNLISGQGSFKDNLKGLAGGLLSSGLQALNQGGQSGGLLGGLLGGGSGGGGLLGGLLGGGSSGGLLESLTGGGFSGGGISSVSNIADTLGFDGLSDSLGGFTSSIGGFTDKLDGVFGAGNGLGGALGVAGIGASLISGDTKGAVSGAGSLAGTLLGGPLGGVIGGQLAGFVSDFLGIGAEWEIEAQHLTANLQGLNASFGQKTIESKKSFGGKKSRTTREDLADVDAEANAQLEGAVDAVGDAVDELSKALGRDLGFDDFRRSIDIIHEDTDDFETRFNDSLNDMFRESIENIVVPGVDSVERVVKEGLRDTFGAIVDGTFDTASQEFFWDPKNFGGIDAQKSMQASLRTAVMPQIQAAISEFDIDGLSTDELESKIQAEFKQAFSANNIDLPAETISDAANNLATQLKTAAETLSDTDFGSGEAQFLATFRDMTLKLSDTAEEAQGVAASLLNTRAAFEAAGVNLDNFQEKVLTSFGGIEAAGAKLGGFAQKFVTDESRRADAINIAQTEISALFSEIKKRGLEVPQTRDAVADLLQEIDLTAPGVREFADRILESQDSLNLFVSTSEAFDNAIRTSADELADATAQVSATFDELGLEIPTTIDDFNQLVAGLDRTSDSGLAAFFELTRIAGEFERVAAGAEQATDAIIEQTDAQIAERERDAENARKVQAQTTKAFFDGFKAVVPFTESMRSLFGTLEQGGTTLAELQSRYTNIEGAQFDSVEALQQFAFTVSNSVDDFRGSREELRAFIDTLGVVGTLTDEQFQADMLAFVELELKRLTQLEGAAGNLTNAAQTAAQSAEDARDTAIKQAQGLINDFAAMQTVIDAVGNSVANDISAIEAALGRAPSAAEQLANIQAQIAALAVDDNSSIEQSIALREQQRVAVLDVLSEELAGIEAKRRAAADVHQSELRAFEARQREIERVIDSARNARSGINDSIGGLQQRINLGGRAPTTGESIGIVQTQLDGLDDNSLGGLQQQLDLQQQLADLELQRLDETLDAQGALAEQQTQALDRLREAGSSLLDTLDALKIDRSTSLFTNKQIFDESKSQFDDLFRAAQGGDADAAGQLGQAARRLLQENQGFNASGQDAVNLQNDVFGKLEQLGIDLENTPENAIDGSAYAADSLQAQQDTVGRLGSIGEAMDATQAALEALQTEQPPAPTELEALQALENTYRETALTQLQGIETATQALGNDLAVNLSDDLFDLGASLGLSQQATTDAIISLGADVLGPRLDAVLNAQSGLSANENSFRNTVNRVAQVESDPRALAEAARQFADVYGLDSSGVARALDTSQSNILNIADQLGIPHFATGGFVDKPTLAVVGDAGPEFIVPAGKQGIRREAAPANAPAGIEFKDMLAELRNQGRQLTRVIDHLADIRTASIDTSGSIKQALKQRDAQKRAVRAV